MGTRREARERAVQFLFQYDLNPPGNLDEALNQFCASQQTAALAEYKGPATWGEKVELPQPTAEESASRLFAAPLIRGTIQQSNDCEEQIKKHRQNLALHRMAVMEW